MSIFPLALHLDLGHVKNVFPIELLRLILALIGVGSAFMAGSTLAAVRTGTVKAGRHYAWMVRAAVCLAAIAFRHSLDAVMLGGWLFAAIAFAAGWWQSSHRKPPEDLSHDIVPRDE